MSEKLAVLFPGVGYQIDRPLLYHSAKLARERGYEVCTVSYPPLPTVILPEIVCPFRQRLTSPVGTVQLPDTDCVR